MTADRRQTTTDRGLGQGIDSQRSFNSGERSAVGGQSFLIDTHCHLDLPQFDGDRDEVIDRAAAAGVQLLINPGINLDSCRNALALADRYPAVYAAVGVHPNESEDFDRSALETLRELAGHPKVVAIGEIGLDYYWDRVPAQQQKRALRAQLDLAAELDLPVILHSRESNPDLLCELSQWGPNVRKKRGEDATLGVWHAFSGDLANAHEAYALGFVLGLGGPVTFKNARQLQGLVPGLPKDGLLLETDAPYLSPQPHRGQRNEPGYIPLVLEKLATLTGVSSEDIASQIAATTFQCFGGLAGEQ